MFEAPLRAVGQLQRLRIDEHGPAGNKLNFAPLAQVQQTLAHALDDLLPLAADAVHVDSRRLEVNPKQSGIPAVGNQLGRVEKCFRRNAADVETRSARPHPRVDQCYSYSLVGGEERSRVAARATANHDEIVFDYLGHRISPWILEPPISRQGAISRRLEA